MNVSVEKTKCMGTGDCVMRCPEVFRFAEGSKKARVIRNPVPEKLEDSCREAVRACPADAISIDSDTVY